MKGIGPAEYKSALQGSGETYAVFGRTSATMAHTEYRNDGPLVTTLYNAL